MNFYILKNLKLILIIIKDFFFIKKFVKKIKNSKLATSKTLEKFFNFLLS